MKVFIFDPLWGQLVDGATKDKLARAGIEIYVNVVVRPLAECKELFEGSDLH